jgi:hypothetical protein
MTSALRSQEARRWHHRQPPIPASRTIAAIRPTCAGSFRRTPAPIARPVPDFLCRGSAQGIRGEETDKPVRDKSDLRGNVLVLCPRHARHVVMLAAQIRRDEQVSHEEHAPLAPGHARDWLREEDGPEAGRGLTLRDADKIVGKVAPKPDLASEDLDDLERITKPKDVRNVAMLLVGRDILARTNEVVALGPYSVAS